MVNNLLKLQAHLCIVQCHMHKKSHIKILHLHAFSTMSYLVHFQIGVELQMKRPDGQEPSLKRLFLSHVPAHLQMGLSINE